MKANLKKELEVLEKMKDEDIDFSDMPELTDEQLARMVPSHFYKPRKKNITMAIDLDVLAKLKSQGKGYQTRINQILRDAVIHH